MSDRNPDQAPIRPRAQPATDVFQNRRTPPPVPPRPKPKLELTPKQLSWAKTFLRGMGMSADVDARIVPQRDGDKMAGSLAHIDEQIDQGTGQRMARDTGVSGAGEKVGRGRLDRVGKGYKTEVVENVNAVIKRANALAAKGSIGAEIDRLVAELTEARDGYEERETGETDRAKLDQRQRKVAAIDARIAALQSVLHDVEVSQLDEVNKMSDAAKGEALAANPSLLAAVLRQDPTEGRAVAALTKLVKTHPAGLSADLEMFELYRRGQPSGEVLDPVILGAIAETDPDDSRVVAALRNLAAKNPAAVVASPAIFEALAGAAPKPDEITKVLDAAGGTDADRLVATLIKRRGDDDRFMNDLCKAVVAQEAGGPGTTGTFFRSNTVATKVTKSFAASGPESKAYLDDAVKLRNQVFGSMSAKTPIELDATRLEPGKSLDVDKAVTFITKICDTILDALYAKPVPAHIATTAAMIADAAVGKGMGQDDVAMMIGGHILLRLINPALTQAKKPGDKALAAHEQRLILLVTKVLQNISNHVVVVTKEVYMAPLVDYTKSKVPAFDRWCFGVAQQGRDLLAREG